MNHRSNQFGLDELPIWEYLVLSSSLTSFTVHGSLRISLSQTKYSQFIDYEKYKEKKNYASFRKRLCERYSHKTVIEGTLLVSFAVTQRRNLMSNNKTKQKSSVDTSVYGFHSKYVNFSLLFSF